MSTADSRVAGSPESQALSDDHESQLAKRAHGALSAAVQALLSKQHDDGHWCAELEGDSILQSEYLLMKFIISEESDPRLPKIINQLRLQQREDGSWGQYPGGTLGGGKFDLSATVKGYFVLKLAGDNVNAPHMAKARKLILEHGGAERINSFSKFYLALLGQVSYNALPIIPPQIVFLPKWFYFHLDKVSAWSRTMIQPLAIQIAHKPVREIPKHLHINELFADQANRDRLLPTGFAKSKFWSGFFLLIDRVLKVMDRCGLLKPGKKAALQKMEDWMIERCEHSDGPGAIFPPIVYLIIALRLCRGYEADHPLIAANHKHLDNYMIYGQRGTPRNGPDDPAADDTIRLQPCESPMWDTGIAAYTLVNAGLTKDHPAVQKVHDYLVAKECRHKGDWAANVPKGTKPAGWYFEYNNPWYPDVDDTVMIAMALKLIGLPKGVDAAQRGVDWVLAMQNSDGGWAAFDKTKDHPLYECVPFADHNAIQDPSCSDITGRTLECLGHHGFGANAPAVKKAIDYLKRTQEKEGCWFGRWGVNYIYGTWQVVGGLKTIGYDMSEPWIQKAGDWLEYVQKDDGSFGESADSYEDPRQKGHGPSTASQTAWAAMSLLAVRGPDDPCLIRAIKWLCDTQLTEPRDESNDSAGSWHEPWFTGTGFPKVFYLRYHLYRLYFPVMALGRWLRAQAG